MPIWYHGTQSRKVYKEIKRNGFKAFTYFTPYLETALSYGGKFIFAINLKKNPIDYWEWICPEIIKPDKILYIKKFWARLLYLNLLEHRKFHHQTLIEDKENASICSTCDGYGEIRKEKFCHLYLKKIGRGAWKARHDPVILCKNCSGHGYLTNNHPPNYSE